MADLTIDLDETDFGFNVLELEIMASDADAVAGAEKQISGKLLQYNLNLEPLTHGKVLMYLKQYHPDLYAKLPEYWSWYRKST